MGVLKPTIELSQPSFDGEVKYLKSNQSHFLNSSLLVQLIKHAMSN